MKVFESDNVLRREAVSALCHADCLTFFGVLRLFAGCCEGAGKRQRAEARGCLWAVLGGPAGRKVQAPQYCVDAGMGSCDRQGECCAPHLGWGGLSGTPSQAGISTPSTYSDPGMGCGQREGGYVPPLVPCYLGGGAVSGLCLEALLGEKFRHPNIVSTLAWAVVTGKVSNCAV